MAAQGGGEEGPTWWRRGRPDAAARGGGEEGSTRRQVRPYASARKRQYAEVEGRGGLGALLARGRLGGLVLVDGHTSA